MNTHYTVNKIEADGSLARGMYACADAYATPELARQLGPTQLTLREGQRLALTQCELEPHEDGRGYRLARQVVLELL